MNFIGVVILTAFVALPLVSWATPDKLTFKSFSVPTDIPKDVIKIVSDYGPARVDPKLSLTWMQNGHHHYFLQVRSTSPKDTGCTIADVDEENKSYNNLDTFGQCKILGKPHLADLNHDG